MKRVLTIAAVSAALIATQAAAGADTAVHAGDRVGGQAKAANHFGGENAIGWVVAGLAVSGVVFALVYKNHDKPVSP